MSLKKLPELSANFRLSTGTQFDIRSDALDRWHPEIQAAQSDDNTISIYDVIGQGWDGEGVSLKRISSALRSIGERDVVVNINSPGGDFFEGVAIYNALRSHKGKVTIQVMGLAASAASLIAMAGDEIRMGDGAFLMIHNAWTIAIGNRHDMADASKRLEPFDDAMASVYANRAGMDKAQAAKLMDEEIWMNSERAITEGFADSSMDDSETQTVNEKTGNKRALAQVEAAMAKAGHSRSARREVFKSLFQSTPSAAQNAMPCAGDDLAALLQNTITTLTK